MYGRKRYLHVYKENVAHWRDLMANADAVWWLDDPNHKIWHRLVLVLHGGWTETCDEQEVLDSDVLVKCSNLMISATAHLLSARCEHYIAIT